MEIDPVDVPKPSPTGIAFVDQIHIPGTAGVLQFGCEVVVCLPTAGKLGTDSCDEGAVRAIRSNFHIGSHAV